MTVLSTVHSTSSGRARGCTTFTGTGALIRTHVEAWKEAQQQRKLFCMRDANINFRDALNK
jgi:hypothetical protein